MKEILLNDPFYISLFLIIIVLIIGVTSKARNKDRCLKHFKNNLVSIENINGEIFAKGILKVKSTGLEIIFPKIINPTQNISQTTYILYKYEYEKIQTIILSLDDMNETGLKHRNKKHKIIKRPSFIRKLLRKIRNIFNSLKDSFIEVMNISMSYLSTKKIKAFKAHDKSVKTINSELVESVGISHDPLLEAYIGKYVVFEFLKISEKILLSGILFDYTKKFIVILNVDYLIPGRKEISKVDMILPQKLTVIRGLIEK